MREYLFGTFGFMCVLLGDFDIERLEGFFHLLLNAAREDFATSVVIPEVFLWAIGTADGVVALSSIVFDTNSYDPFGQSGGIGSVATIFLEGFSLGCHDFSS